MHDMGTKPRQTISFVVSSRLSRLSHVNRTAPNIVCVCQVYCSMVHFIIEYIREAESHHDTRQCTYQPIGPRYI